MPGSAVGDKRPREEEGADAETNSKTADNSEADKNAPQRKPDNRGNGTGVWIDVKDPAKMQNAAFERYYRGTIIPEAEWPLALATLQRSLPMAVHINVSLGDAACRAVHALVVAALSGSGFVSRPLPFVTKEMALQADVSRGELKRNAEFRRSKKIVNALTELGFCSRQETVSMLPPTLLGVRGGHRVLDMCAAPGSKTAQLLEDLMAGGTGGCVVANDVNAGRLRILCHQMARLPTGCANLLVHKGDAQYFPLPSDPSAKFDRVLCDVICSGDGTLRKSYDLWARWNPFLGPALHLQQAAILLRGMHLCRKGGRVVYSTCSLNPLEDEAVVAHCLREAKGSFVLADATAALPGLRFAPGVSTWRVANKDASAFFADFKAFSAAPTGSVGFGYRESMFPPTEAEAATLRLDRCVRILPHLQDTGGFFLCALDCVDDFPVPLPKKTKVRAPLILPLDAATIDGLRRALGLDEADGAAFPWASLYSSVDNSRKEAKFYYVHPDAAQLINDTGCAPFLAGAKVLECASPSLDSVRIVSDAAAVLAPLLPPRMVVDAPAEALRLLASGLPLPWATLVPNAATPRPKRNFIVRCALPGGHGTLHFAAVLQSASPSEATAEGSGAAVAAMAVVRVPPPALLLARLSLGMDVGDDGGDAADAGVEDGGAGADDAGDE